VKAIGDDSPNFAANLTELEQKIRVGAVSYLNTKPLLYGIRHSQVIDRIDLILDYPAQIARLLQDRQIDIGLVPIAVIPSLEEYHIVSEYCIGCDGPVASVCLFSEVPVAEIEEVLLDYQSRTSVALLKILLKKYWRISPRFVQATSEDYRHQIQGKTAGLVIGDRALEQRKISTFIYDLGEAWKNYSGLNFVFAAWVSNRELDVNFIREFNLANRKGVESIEQVIAENPYPVFDLNKYYRYHINYKLDEKKKLGMEEFLFQLNQLTPA
jgi:chorismate dehydratase